MDPFLSQVGQEGTDTPSDFGDGRPMYFTPLHSDTLRGKDQEQRGEHEQDHSRHQQGRSNAEGAQGVNDGAFPKRPGHYGKLRSGSRDAAPPNPLSPR